jgi:hypothetical protein
MFNLKLLLKNFNEEQMENWHNNVFDPKTATIVDEILKLGQMDIKQHVTIDVVKNYVPGNNITPEAMQVVDQIGVCLRPYMLQTTDMAKLYNHIENIKLNMNLSKHLNDPDNRKLVNKLADIYFDYVVDHFLDHIAQMISDPTGGVSISDQLN